MIQQIKQQFATLFFLLLGLYSDASENSKGSIQGKVSDRITKEPLEYVNVALYRSTDSSLFSGGITNQAGEFNLQNIKEDEYYLKFSFIGYRDKIISPISISSKNNSIKLDSVFLVTSDFSLEDFTVVGEKTIIENNLDKKVFNVEKDLTVSGGTALDVVKNIPFVSVDNDGNISLRGSGNVNVLIDGKPSSLSPAQILEQIPANMIQSIELITNPSAKYDPDGMSGILNIVTKKNNNDGYNGTINLNAGTRHKYNGTATFNYRVSKINLFASYDLRYHEKFRIVNAHRFFTLNDTLTTINQVGRQLDKAWNHTGKVGFDYYMNKFNSLSISGTIRTESAVKSETINYTTLDYKEDQKEKSIRSNNTDREALNFDVLLNYKKTFKQKGREWTFDASFSDAFDSEDLYAFQNFSQSNYLFNDLNIQDHNLNTSATRIITAQTDYVHPTEKYGRFEMGLKTILRNYNTGILFENYIDSLSIFQNNPGISNDFEYADQLYSAYFIYANAFKKWQYQLGVRTEQAYTASKQVATNLIFKNEFLNIFPTVHIKKKLLKDNEFSISYSRRINRPGVRSLNPFTEYNDPLLFRTGNPYLQPEFIHSFELGYAQYFNKWSFTVTPYYRNTKNVIIRYRELYPNGVAVVSQLNLAENNTVGMDFVLGINPHQKLRITFSGGAYYFMQTAYPEYDLREVKNFNTNAKFNANYSIVKGFDVQVSGFYHAPMVLAQGYMKAMYSMDFGLRKEVLKGKGNVNIRFSDIFNTQQFWIITDSENFYLDTRFKRETQILYLGFTYKINGGSNRKEKQIQSNESGGGDF